MNRVFEYFYQLARSNSVYLPEYLSDHDWYIKTDARYHIPHHTGCVLHGHTILSCGVCDVCIVVYLRDNNVTNIAIDVKHMKSCEERVMEMTLK